MEKINFTNGQAPALNGANLNKLQENVEKAIKPIEEEVNKIKKFVNVIYPIGSIYITANEVNPNELFEGTEWEQIKDKFLLAAGDEYKGGSAGGSKEHHHLMGLGTYNNKLVVSNKNAEQGALIENAYTVTGTNGFEGVGNVNEYVYGTQDASSMPPYLTVYVYKRIA